MPNGTTGTIEEITQSGVGPKGTTGFTTTQFATQFKGAEGRAPSQQELVEFTEIRKRLGEAPPPGVPSAGPAVVTTRGAAERVGERQQELAGMEQRQQQAFQDQQRRGQEQLLGREEPARPTGISPEAQQLQDINRGFEDQVNAFNEQLTQFGATLDAQTNAQIAGLGAEFKRRAEEMKRINQARQGGLALFGARAGRTRFAPEIQAGIISNEEREASGRISALIAQEQELVRAARAANTSKQFSLFAQKMGNIREIQDRKRQELLDLNVIAKQESERISAKAQAQREQAITAQQEIEKIAELTAPLLLSQDAAGELVRPSQEDIFAIAQESGLDPLFLNKAVQTEFERLSTFTADARKSALAFSTAQAKERRAESSELRAQQLQAGKITLQQGAIDINQAKLVTEQVAAEARARGDLSPDQFNTAQELNKSVTGSQQFKDLLDIRNGLRGVEIGLSQETGFGDIAAINSFQRMIDPGATVRSEDVKLLQEAAGLFSKLDTKFQRDKLEKGDKLPPDVRKRMLDLSKELHDGSVDAFTTSPQIESITNLADSAGVDTKFLGIDFEKTTDIKFDAFTSVADVKAAIQTDPRVEAELRSIKLEFPTADDDQIRQILNSQLGLTGGNGGGSTIEVKELPTKTELNTLSNGQNNLSRIGQGTTTGIDGSSLWKWGLDFVLKGGLGAPVPSPFSGIVKAVTTKGGFGNRVKILLDDGNEMWVSHLQGFNVKKGQRIAQGDKIGTQGNSGSVLGGAGEKLSASEVARGRGTHLDLTIKKPDGSFFKAREVAAILGDNRLA